MKILLIEDSDVSAHVTTHSLALCNGTLNADVIRAKDFRDALALVADAEVVVCDLSLPDSDQEQTLGFLKQLRKQRPVVILSGCTDPECISRAGSMGVAYLLKESATPKDLETALFWQQAAWQADRRRRRIVNRMSTILK